jgi:hypothetical protein
MARKLEVSVVSTVVGARRDARVRFLDPRDGAGTGGAAAGASAWPDGRGGETLAAAGRGVVEDQ